MAARRPLVNVVGSLQELPAGDLVPVSALGSGTPDGAKFLRDDGTWAAPPSGTGGGGGLFSTVDGNFTLYAAQTSEITITNYDSLTAYLVSATGGTVSRLKDVIKYTAGTVAGDYAITLTSAGTDRTLPITIWGVATPSVIGEFVGGGYYAGRIIIDGATYALIVAPKATGQFVSIAAGTSVSTTSGTVSKNDGWANTTAMDNAAYPMMKAIRSLVLNGYQDWYLPSRDELEVCYRNLRSSAATNETTRANRLPGDVVAGGVNQNSSPVGVPYTASVPPATAALAFKTGGGEEYGNATFVSSTEFSAAGFAGLSFTTGAMTTLSKTSTAYMGRAVRRVRV